MLTHPLIEIFALSLFRLLSRSRVMSSHANLTFPSNSPSNSYAIQASSYQFKCRHGSDCVLVGYCGLISHVISCRLIGIVQNDKGKELLYASLSYNISDIDIVFLG